MSDRPFADRPTTERPGPQPRGPDPFAGGRAPSLQDLPPGEALRSAARYLGEIKSYAIHYLVAKTDSLKLTAKRTLMLAGLALVGILVGAALIVTACVLLLAGLANLLSATLDPPRPWFGQLLVGLIALAAALTAGWLLLRRLIDGSRAQTFRKYHAMRRHERREYGHDVAERSRR